MSNFQSSIKKYPLLPFSQLVYDITRWMPSVYRFSVLLRWKDGAEEKDRIENVIRRALENHPVFSMQIDWKGRHYASEQKDILHGEYHDVTIYTKGNDLYLNMSVNRILGDAKSGQILLEDIERAYKGLPLEPDDYWGYVARYEQHKSETHYTISHDWLKQEFADASIPVRPTMDRRWLTTIFPPKAGLHEEDYTALREKIERLSKEQFMSYEGIFSLCAAMAIADYCNTDNAALTWAYDGREKPDEQRIFGSLHRDVPFQIQKSKITNRESAIRLARNQIRSGISHSDYPYTLASPYNKRWNYAVNVLRVPDPEDVPAWTGLPIEIESIPEQKYAYALLDVEIIENVGTLRLQFRYSATHYKSESIQKFAALVHKYVEWLID